MDFLRALSKRILVLDGAMGTMLQRAGLSGGDNELLNVTNPEAILDIHREYINAGADIIETNSFGANSLSQAEYGHSCDAGLFSYESARIARKAADEAPRKVWVAGSVGPTGVSLSLPSNAAEPTYREVDFTAMTQAYCQQIDNLQKGGVDIILLETCFDALNAKAAILAKESIGCTLPLIISATVSDKSGRTLTGQTLESFYTSVKYAPDIVAFGINCALGANAMKALVTDISQFSSLPLVFYPNAGIPDELGQYSDSPSEMAEVLRTLAVDGMLNIVGGCCGTTPEHIRAIARAVDGIKPGIPQKPSEKLSVSGLETVTIDRQSNFTNIGERTNVTGSRKFARIISEGNYDKALEVAAAQIDGGAPVIDVNMDDPLLDSASCMRDFVRSISSDPSVGRAALMIDSSDWNTVLEGLRNAQGKCIVNSISLKDGEDVFLDKARQIRSYGAAMVVMAFDEDGQAETFERKIHICERSYNLLTRKAQITPSDIIFDCNILAIATGIPEHARLGVDFIEAVRWIKANLAGALTSGGLSNLSFAFRGNNAVREAMHSVFLYHAVQAGLDMAIVNPQLLEIYDNIEPQLREMIEDVIFDRHPDATSRLIAKAASLTENTGTTSSDSTAANGETHISDNPSERLREALISGDASHIGDDALKCLEEMGTGNAVVEGPLMEGMEKVGELFAAGKMFLPQVVKSAKIMRLAIDALTPYLANDSTDINNGRRPVFVIATVQGDVHDIGKKITASVLMCSGFIVHDLGVMVPCDQILDKAESLGADFIGVSGLITPSLAKMEQICRQMNSRGMNIPLFVGGAATSAIHTALKLSPLYDFVFHGADASATAVMAKKYLQSRDSFIKEERAKILRLLAIRSSANPPICKCCCPPVREYDERLFSDVELTQIPSEDLMSYFDWKMFSAVCSVRDVSIVREEALSMLKDMNAKVCARFVNCRREGENLSFDTSRGHITLNLPHGPEGSVVDYFPDGASAQLGFFAVKADIGPWETDNLLAHACCVTLAEAGSAYLCRHFSSTLPAGFKVVLPAIGYPVCPDHSLKELVLSLLPSEIGIALTESFSMIPEASICGFVCGFNDSHQ